MSYQQAPPTAGIVGYPPPGTGYPPPGQQAYVAPPPAAYPTKDGGAYPQEQYQPDTRSRGGRGDGFWKGCCAALCCCCLLDACF